MIYTKYTRYTLCSELLRLIDDNATNERITNWASTIYYRYNPIFEKGVKEVLFDFTLFDLPDPDFVYSKDELLKLCAALLKGANLENVTSINDIIKTKRT
jgi:hypothetical protein